jgi:hypothetical protein
MIDRLLHELKKNTENESNCKSAGDIDLTIQLKEKVKLLEQKVDDQALTIHLLSIQEEDPASIDPVAKCF